MKLTLPWPSQASGLSPNSRVHWRVKAKATKKAREMSHWLAMEAGASRARAHLSDEVPVRLIFHPPPGKVPDEQNAIASVKAHLDGIADALQIDDVRFRLSHEMSTPERPGRVEVEIG